MYKKSFSLLEIIFIIIIISIISIVAIPKIFNNIDTATIIKLRSDVTLIRSGIVEFKNKQVLLNSTENLNTLESNSQLLFNKVLSQPILQEEHKSGSWYKTSSNKYKAWLGKEKFVEFTYNTNDFTFNCNFSQDYCKELSQ